MINWIKEVYCLYMKGAEENTFSFEEYGFLGERKK